MEIQSAEVRLGTSDAPGEVRIKLLGDDSSSVRLLVLPRLQKLSQVTGAEVVDEDKVSTLVVTTTATKAGSYLLYSLVVGAMEATGVLFGPVPNPVEVLPIAA